MTKEELKQRLDEARANYRWAREAYDQVRGSDISKEEFDSIDRAHCQAWEDNVKALAAYDQARYAYVQARPAHDQAVSGQDSRDEALPVDYPRGRGKLFKS